MLLFRNLLYFLTTIDMNIDLNKIAILDNDDIVYHDRETKKLRFKLNNLYIPFGIEKYYISFKNKDKNNMVYNYYVVLKCIDEHFEKMEGFGNTYVPFIKQSGNYDPLIRCHLKSKKDNIITKFYENGELTESNKIKKKMCNASISISSLWTKGDKYGVIIYVDKIEVL